MIVSVTGDVEGEEVERPVPLLTGWSQTRSGEPVGTMHAVDDVTGEALCGAAIVHLGSPWPRGLGPRCRICEREAAQR